MTRSRALTAEEIASEAFRQLLWCAVEVDDAELDRILTEEIPELVVIDTLTAIRDGPKPKIRLHV